MDLYEHDSIAGKGSFGTVDLYRRKTDGRLVIIKKISLTCTTKEEEETAYNEVDVMSQLKHPNIICYYDWFVTNNVVCIIMEYASGGTLQDFIKEHGNQLILEDEVVFFFSQLLHGLHHIHKQGILHRDLKPTNILLQNIGPDLVVKIADFGISKILESKTRAVTVVGTPCYLAPELCEGLPYNKSSDIWALGCVLYEMMTLKKAFEGQTLGFIVRSILQCQLATPNTEAYTPLLRNLLERLLSADPAQRPSTSMIMADPAVTETCHKLCVNIGRINNTS